MYKAYSPGAMEGSPANTISRPTPRQRGRRNTPGSDRKTRQTKRITPQAQRQQTAFRNFENANAKVACMC